MSMKDLNCISLTAGAATKWRQDEQELQDRFRLRPTGVVHVLSIEASNLLIRSILFILSRNKLSI